MGGDFEQDYFIDGVVEDILSALSRVRWLFVIARDSIMSGAGPIMSNVALGTLHAIAGFRSSTEKHFSQRPACHPGQDQNRRRQDDC
jgi:hypothetical protein